MIKENGSIHDWNEKTTGDLKKRKRIRQKKERSECRVE